MLATGRSLGRSVPAPFTLQGLADSTPSATAGVEARPKHLVRLRSDGGRLASRERATTGRSKRFSGELVRSLEQADVGVQQIGVETLRRWPEIRAIGEPGTAQASRVTRLALDQLRRRGACRLNRCWRTHLRPSGRLNVRVTTRDLWRAYVVSDARSRFAVC